MATEAAACRCRRRIFLRGRQHRGARGKNQNEIPARADAAAKPRRHRGALQFLRRCRQGCRLRQAETALQDLKAAVLRRLGDAGHPRHPRRPAHQCALPGDRHERRGDPRPLLRRRIGRRLFHARPAARGVSGIYRREKCRRAKRCVVTHQCELTVHRPTLPSSPSLPGPAAAPALRPRKTAADGRRAGAPTTL